MLTGSCFQQTEWSIHQKTSNCCARNVRLTTTLSDQFCLFFKKSHTPMTDVVNAGNRMAFDASRHAIADTCGEWDSEESCSSGPERPANKSKKIRPAKKSKKLRPTQAVIKNERGDERPAGDAVAEQRDVAVADQRDGPADQRDGPADEYISEDQKNHKRTSLVRLSDQSSVCFVSNHIRDVMQAIVARLSTKVNAKGGDLKTRPSGTNGPRKYRL